MTPRSTRTHRIFDNPKFRPLVDHAMKDIQAYWMANVEKYFSHAASMRSNVRTTDMAFTKPGHTGQMKNACKVVFLNSEITVIFKSIRSEDGKDYGDYLVYGSPSSRGKYVPEIGARLHDKTTGELIGETRGISTGPWNRWMVEFNTFIEKRLDQLEDEIYKASSIDDILGEDYDKRSL